MKALKMFNLFIIVALLIGLSVTWVGAIPSSISGDKAIGNCCNWDSSKWCPTSPESTNACQTSKCYTNSTGSGTKTSHTYCIGAQYCEQATGYTCSIGHNCSI